MSPHRIGSQSKTLRALGLLLATITAIVAQSTNPAPLRFKYERFDARGGALHRSRGGHDNFVEVVFLDSSNRVWVGTMTGLAIYDGKQWTNTTFKAKGGLSSFFGISDIGVDEIAEGPAGTIWLNDFCKVRDNRFEEIGPRSKDTILGTAVDRQGSLWVVTKTQVRKYDGKAWTTVLSPYAKTLSYKTGGLHGIAIETNGHVWIGGTIHGELKGPWEHEGGVWVVDKKKQAGGPPSAALFEFNGNSWKAFGPEHGLPLLDGGWAIPELDSEGRLVIETRQGYQDRVLYIRERETWNRVHRTELFWGRQWIVRERDASVELLFREREQLIRVQPTDHQTGETMDVGSLLLHFGKNRVAEDNVRSCLWLGTEYGIYRVSVEPAP